MDTGIFAASLTPMHKDFSCNHEALTEHGKDLIKRGCSGVLLFGTTGEGISFSVEERQKALKAVIQQGLIATRVIMGIGCTVVEDAIKLATTAMELNCSAVLILPPFFYKNVSEEGILAFYREVISRIKSSKLKVLLYHIPKYSGVPITIDIIQQLTDEFPLTVVGIKDSDGDITFTKQVISTFPEFKVYVGNDLQIPEAVQSGAAGGITGASNAFPELICSLYKNGHNLEQARSTISTLKKYPIIPAIKCVVKQQKGDAWHVLRPPLLPLNAQQSQTLKVDLS